MKVFKNLYKKLFGELVYVVTIESIYGERSIYEVNDIKIIHEQVNELNEDGQYHHMVSKVEKKRVYPFKYDKLIKHYRLTFAKDGLTEKVYSEKDDHIYSFLIIDKSLTNVKRIN